MKFCQNQTAWKFTSIKKRLQHRYSPVNFSEIFQNIFFTDDLHQLLLPLGIRYNANVHKACRRGFGRFLNALCMFNLSPVSRRKSQKFTLFSKSSMIRKSRKTWTVVAATEKIKPFSQRPITIKFGKMFSISGLMLG